jgi:pyruvate dehydrogenase E1 component
VPPLSAFDALLKAGGEGREFSTTMSFVRGLNVMLKDKVIGKRVVPIVVDESRTFGMEGLFRQIGIWNQDGQNYVPQDADQMMFYKETRNGQILQEGINEAGAMADWIAAGTSYSTHGVQMIPVYVCYSMFGMQRTMDLVWAAGDQRAAASWSAAPPGAPRSTAKACSTRTAIRRYSPARCRTALPTIRPSPMKSP